MCHVVVETPVNLTSRQKELLKEFEEISKGDAAKHTPKSKTWFDKVTELLRRLVAGDELHHKGLPAGSHLFGGVT